MNDIGTPRVYFGNFANGDTPIPNTNNAAFEFCGSFDPLSQDLVDSTRSGSFDLMNFIWFQGSEGLFQDLSSTFSFKFHRFTFYFLDPACSLTGFIQPNQASCLICAIGNSMQDYRTCVNTSPDVTYFMHSATNSYQSNPIFQ